MKRSDLFDTPERRSIAITEFEIRKADSGRTLKLRGYASVVEKAYDIYGGPPMGWAETIAATAFDKTLREKPDVHLLVNHEGLPLARTKSGTLRLSVDKTGLLVDADLDAADADVQRIETKMERRDLDEMSMAFRVLGQEWSEDETERRITEVSLHKGDVSIVNFGANPNTSASLRGAVQVLADADADLLVAELRSQGASDDLDSAIRHLAAARATAAKPTRLTSWRSIVDAREHHGTEA